MSFQEKSLWLLFISLLGIFGSYFGLVLFTFPKGSAVHPRHIGLFAGLVAVLVVIQIAGNIALAIIGKLTGSLSGRHDTDERDRLIELKSSRNGSFVLAVGVCLSLWAAVVTDGNFTFTHLLLAFWVLAQLVETGSQLFMYRRGA